MSSHSKEYTLKIEKPKEEESSYLYLLSISDWINIDVTDEEKEDEEEELIDGKKNGVESIKIQKIKLKDEGNIIKITKIESDNDELLYPQYLLLCNPNNMNDYQFYAIHLDEYIYIYSYLF